MTDTQLLIVNRLGTVHAVRHGTTCTAVRDAPRRKYVTAVQALVYNLPRCYRCFPEVSKYKRLVGRPS